VVSDDFGTNLEQTGNNSFVQKKSRHFAICVPIYRKILRKKHYDNQETGCFISHGNRLIFRMGYLKFVNF